MNETTQNVVQTDLMTKELERLWLLSALGVGLDQLHNGQTQLANETYFDALEMRMFGADQETIIEA